MDLAAFKLSTMFGIIAIACLLLAPTVVVSQVCYDPSGNVLIRFGICNDAASSSLCCPISEVCTANGLCLNPITGNFNRGGCTDKSFADPICPGFCIATSYPEVLPCNKSSTNSFCCDSEAKGQCCQEPSNFLNIGPAISSADAVPATTESAASTSTSGSASTTLTSSTPSSPSSSSSPSPAAAGHSNTSVQVGVGVGVSMGSVAAISALTFLWFRRRKRARKALEKEDDVPELPPLLAHNRMNSKLFPAELDPEGEGLKGPAELDPDSSTQGKDPVELATAPAELPAEPVELDHDVKNSSIRATPAASRVPSLKEDEQLVSSTSPTEAVAVASVVSSAATGPPEPDRSTQLISESHTFHPHPLHHAASTTNEASSPQSDQQVPPPPPPSLATVPPSATTTPKPSPPRGEFIRHGKGAELIHPNQSAWSLEQEQEKVLSADKGLEEPPRPQTIAERRNMGSPSLISTSGPWHNTYHTKSVGNRTEYAGSET